MNSHSSHITNSFCIFIPARSGSKGLKNKNKLLFGGLLLIEHTILLALNLKCQPSIYVSSDDEDVLALAKKYPSINFLFREPDLSQDDSSLIDLIVSLFVDNPSFNFTSVILLQPTSPFRCLREVDSLILRFLADTSFPLVSVTKSYEHPFECIYQDCITNEWHPFTNLDNFNGRQEYQVKPYFLSGSFYASSLELLQITRSFISHTTRYIKTLEPISVDIDTPNDFLVATSLIPLMSDSGYYVPSQII